MGWGGSTQGITQRYKCLLSSITLSQEDPLEEEMATHFSVCAQEIPWTEETGRLQSMGLQSWTQLSNSTTLYMHTHTYPKSLTSSKPI